MLRFKLVIIFLFFSKFVFSQCANADFEYGNFTNWTGKRGSCCPIVLPTNGIVAGRQTIMTQGIDPHSCGGLNMVYQGMYSARLGNDATNSRAESLSYSFVIGPSNTLVQYAYAVVLQDPGHNAGDQPRFQSRVRAQNGSVIPCTDYTVMAGPNLPNYHYCAGFDQVGIPTNTAWSDWRVISLDLSAYIGQTVTLEFETGDCDLGAHYGYAYIDAISCGPIDSEVYYCTSSNSVLVQAPQGFASYQWVETGDLTRVITVPPNVYDTLHVNVTTMTGCDFQLVMVLIPYGVLGGIVCDSVCLGNEIAFINLTPVVPEYTLSFLWDFGDNTTSTQFSPTHTYSQPNTYNVTLTVTVVGTNCIDTTDCEVKIFIPPTINNNNISHD